MTVHSLYQQARKTIWNPFPSRDEYQILHSAINITAHNTASSQVVHNFLYMNNSSRFFILLIITR